MQGKYMDNLNSAFTSLAEVNNAICRIFKAFARNRLPVAPHKTHVVTEDGPSEVLCFSQRLNPSITPVEMGSHFPAALVLKTVLPVILAAFELLPPFRRPA